MPISNRHERSQSEIDTTCRLEIGTTSIDARDIYHPDLFTIVGDKIVYPNVELTAIGEKVENVIIQMSNYSKLIEIDSYVIMPNHIHMIVFLFDDVVPISNRVSPPESTPKR